MIQQRDADQVIKGPNPFYQLTREPMLLAVVLFLLALLGLFIVYPLIAVARMSLTSSDGNFSAEVYKYVFTHHRYKKAIGNSVLLGTIVATTATFIGYVFAFALTRGQIRWKAFFNTMAILPIISPPFMFALSVILLFGRNGLITAGLLKLDVSGLYGLKGLVIVQTIGMFPMAYMTLSGILQGIDPDLDTCAMNLGAKRGRAFFTVTLPLCVPGIFASWLLVFVASLTDFGNPIILGGDFDVLSVQAYLEFTGMGNLARGTALAILLLVPTVGVFFIQKYIMKNKTYTTITGKSSRRGVIIVGPVVRNVLFAFCLLFSLFVLMFYVTIISGSFIKLWGVNWGFTLEHFAYSWDVGSKTMWNTVFLALISTPITAFMGMAIAYIVVRKSFPGKDLMEFLSMLSYAIPGTCIGIGYILAFNKAPFELSGTAFILVACYVFRNVPIGVESGIAALKQISPEIEESSTNLGGTSGYTFQHITLPLIRPSFFAGATFAFVRSMTAISAIIFLVSARWNHMTVLVLAQTEIMRLGVASVMSFALIVVILSVILLIMKLTGLKQAQVFGTSN
ncbi:iron ABC transporter permease [Oceanispirochaeta sp.]|jgi:iron(III) transport system permease protein|uniref:ABC transporter permease n=1 Tax=Oceanispirochaeta sp. TaxID=2035350 RepID=UPI0026098D82|nr:iron ABC transporter permease [Oceanispirochaeta sp.]MDA3955972.1 iron ABC transporter permease [Oceanispirochaeta sp.]